MGCSEMIGGNSPEVPQLQPVISQTQALPMIGENRQLVKDAPVEFEK